MTYPNIRYAQCSDISAIQRMARPFKSELGFVMRVALERAIHRREVYVAEQDDQIIGFVNWHARRDGWRTIYEIAVHPNHHRQGVGRQLLYTVVCPIRLKCTTDNETANTFYKGAGMQLTDIEAGRKRALNIWEMRILSVFCAGNNTRFPEIARQSGMAYGSRHDDQIRAWPFMLDINWRAYEWGDYLQQVKTHHPVTAMVADYEHPEQRHELYHQIRDLRAANVLRIMVCPKFDGAIKHIPSWCVIAISVPSAYAGFIPELSELKGRRVHLLGGSPVKQREWILRLNSVASVISYDGNAHTSTASSGGYWKDGHWQFDKQDFDYYDLCKLSGRNIVTSMNEAARWQQLGLFP